MPLSFGTITNQGSLNLSRAIVMFIVSYLMQSIWQLKYEYLTTRGYAILRTLRLRIARMDPATLLAFRQWEIQLNSDVVWARYQVLSYQECASFFGQQINFQPLPMPDFNDFDIFQPYAVMQIAMKFAVRRGAASLQHRAYPDTLFFSTAAEDAEIAALGGPLPQGWTIMPLLLSISLGLDPAGFATNCSHVRCRVRSRNPLISPSDSLKDVQIFRHVRPLYKGPAPAGVCGRCWNRAINAIDSRGRRHNDRVAAQTHAENGGMRTETLSVLRAGGNMVV